MDREAANGRPGVFWTKISSGKLHRETVFKDRVTVQMRCLCNKEWMEWWRAVDQASPRKTSDERNRETVLNGQTVVHMRCKCNREWI